MLMKVCSQILWDQVLCWDELLHAGPGNVELLTGDRAQGATAFISVFGVVPLGSVFRYSSWLGGQTEKIGLGVWFRH